MNNKFTNMDHSSGNAVPGTAGVSPALGGNHASAVFHPPPKGWHSRGYLPHFDAEHIAQFITIRLTASLPSKLVRQWNESLKHLPAHMAETEIRKLVEKHLDEGRDHTWLRKKSVAETVQNALLHFHERRYLLFSWVIMPNHVHIVFTPIPGFSIPAIMHSFKSFTAKKANRILNRNGRFWHPDYYDRFIRDEKHYYQVMKYIEMNPVKAGLCVEAEDWRWSSAYAVG